MPLFIFTLITLIACPVVYMTENPYIKTLGTAFLRIWFLQLVFIYMAITGKRKTENLCEHDIKEKVPL